MKTLRDTNNNNSNTTNSSPIRQNFMASSYPNPTISDSNSYLYSPSITPIRLQQQTTTRNTHDPSSFNPNVQQVASSSIQNNYSINSNSLQSPLNLFASIFSGDSNQLSSIIQSYLSKFNGNQTLQFDPINPLFYWQSMNTNAMLMQQLSANQTNIHSIATDNQRIQNETTNSGKTTSSLLQANSNIFVPKTRPMTHNEIAEHARSVYQRALQRNQLQQHHDLMKHFYETLNMKQQDCSVTSTMKSTDHNEVPSVPHVSNIGTFDVLDTMITSSASCLSIKELSIDAALSSLSLLSTDETKMITNTNSILNPSAPIFIPRQSRLKLDDDNETSSSSSSDSDFNDFHYLDQFLDECYRSDNEHDNHLIIRKSSSLNATNYSNEFCNNKPAVNHSTLGQGDVLDETIEQPLLTTVEKQGCQYSIYELLNRYRNPRCHLVLPEWSRLSSILPNVCSMRSHNYKIKRYFAYRRRLHEDENLNRDLNTSISVQG